ncbi:MAG: rRNA maturation RNase YbeY [Akkermansiaceae bacterium]|nr:rRNA maturation RNase YbeY [Akkermansiaceae bacterium]
MLNASSRCRKIASLSPLQTSPMSLEVIIGNNQQATEIPESWLTALERVAHEAARLALENAAEHDSPLHHLATLEVALVDDATSDQVHRDFMQIDGPTDVITFHHGEIVIGAQVAERQAAEYGEPLGREILRYFVHGLLHLAGHEDAEADERAAMEAAQEKIVSELWSKGLSEWLC